MNYGQMTPEEHEAELRKAAQAVLMDQWNQERREEAERANREHERPVKGVSSARVLPQVHEALRENDPKSTAPSTQPSLPKKAPPTSGRGLPAGFIRSEEPPRIGTEQAQPAPPPKLPADTPMTPAHPPHPPLSTLPEPLQDSKNLQHQLH